MEQRKTRDRHIPSPAGAEMNAYRVRDVPSVSLFNAAFPGRTNIPTPRPKSEQGNAPACRREESKKLTGKWWRIRFWKPDGGLGEPEPVSEWPWLCAASLGSEGCRGAPALAASS